ncbi:hypothetical protein HO133_003974 [Letharia lupina]|uniref:Uncharacterized protein n=1 Tax=Letharia lupina TaxID=560253 RepID=A0A8H6C9R3_9LECA|nr:uncharacterized protein HO133_003974 [Letharia lupina]KAF6219505.1 hypothetical protein HO133_003974 [Letharia lupina]
MPTAINVEAEVFIPGQLSYLPKRRDDEPFSLSGSEIPDGCSDHPVVILATDQRERKAVVLILTSFGGKSLNEHSSIPRIRASHLPIHPSPVHPDNGILLFLDQDIELRKMSYVNTESPRQIEWALLQRHYREQRTGERFRLRPDSFAKLLDYIGSEAPLGRGTSVAPQSPLHPSTTYSPGWDLLESMKANSLAQYGSINRPTVPPRRISEPARYLVRAPTATSTLQAVARSREGAAAEVDRYLAQRREARRHETRAILPTHRPSPRSDSSYDPMSILRKLFVAVLVAVGLFFAIAWWRK